MLRSTVPFHHLKPETAVHPLRMWRIIETLYVGYSLSLYVCQHWTVEDAFLNLPHIHSTIGCVHHTSHSVELWDIHYVLQQVKAKCSHRVHSGHSLAVSPWTLCHINTQACWECPHAFTGMFCATGGICLVNQSKQAAQGLLLMAEGGRAGPAGWKNLWASATSCFFQQGIQDAFLSHGSIVISYNTRESRGEEESKALICHRSSFYFRFPRWWEKTRGRHIRAKKYRHSSKLRTVTVKVLVGGE